MKGMLFFFIANASLCLKAQSDIIQLKEPEIGKECPNFFFKEVDFYPKSTVSLQDFKGKWLILDFWAKNCSSCIASFPIINEEQKAFKDSLQFLMVTYKDKENQHRPMYANFHNKQDLKMPCAFDINMNVFKQFNVGTLPHYIIINPKGIVKAITYKIEEKKLKQLLSGENPVFIEASYNNDKDKVNKFYHDEKLPYLIQNNGGIDSIFLFRSLLAKWTLKSPSYITEHLIHSDRENELVHNLGRYEVMGIGLIDLYRAAYFGTTFEFTYQSPLYGKYWPNPILEMKDTSNFETDFTTGKNLYCYSLVIPPSQATESRMESFLQNDLKNYFGYKVFWEIRKMPYWRITATKEARSKLLTKGETENFSNNNKPWQTVSLRNCSTIRFANIVKIYSGVGEDGAPVLDETEIPGNIDIDAEWLKGDYISVFLELKKNGLDLVKGEKEMKVLILKDPY